MMNIRNLAAATTLAIAALAAPFTRAAANGDIFEILPVQSVNNQWVYSLPTEPLDGGDTAYFVVRLMKPSPGSNQFRLVHQGSTSEAVDWAAKRPSIGIYVNGVFTVARLEDYYIRTDNIFTDFIFSYTVKPGDFALPIRLALADGSMVTDANDEPSGSYYLDFLDLSLPYAPVWRVDDSTDTEPATRDANFFYGSMRYSAASPDASSTGRKRTTDYDLSKCNFRIQTVDFDPNPESTEFWRSVHQHDSIAQPVGKTPSLVVSGMPTNSVTLYVWSTNESAVVLIDGGDVESVSTRDVHTTASVAESFQVGVVKIVDGKQEYKLNLRGVSATNDATIVLSAFPDFHYNSLNERLDDEYLTRVVRCVGPKPPPTYLDPTDGDAPVKTCDVYALYTGQTTLTSGWYVVEGSVNVSSRITVKGDANLLLLDNAELKANKGIKVHVGNNVTNSLTVWAQSDGATMGKLKATGGTDWDAGIGGEMNVTCGTVTVNGGEVKATGYDGAGIGGGYGRSGGTVTVNSGKVTATSDNGGAGIGGGFGGSGGTVTVNGGEVTATGGDNGGAGIGGGYNGSGGTVTINGGKVTATGANNGGAGIGGGNNVSGGRVTITGGEVKATGDNNGGAGIGGGFGGSGETVTVKPSAGTAIAVAAGASEGSASPIDGSPFMAETNVTGRVSGKRFVRTKAVPTYLDPTDSRKPIKTCAAYTLYTGQTTLDSGWYVVEGSVTNDARIYVNGDAHLILCDGVELMANAGINVDVNNNVTNSLTIWAQSDGAGMGKVIAQGSSHCAGIGGGDGGACGTVTVNGGEVAAYGVSGGAGIGGGQEGAGGTVTINGGAVAAQGLSGAAGIGGGHHGAGGTVTVNGGEVTAQGSAASAGIGGGSDGSGGKVTVNGGTVKAQGGVYGAGIGGGRRGAGGTVTVNGGEVTATGDLNGVGIGGGNGGAGGTVTINPSAGIVISVAAGDDEASAAPVSGSPFTAQADVTERLSGKRFARTWLPPSHTVTVEGGSTTNSPAAEGIVVTVTANPPARGEAFVQWALCEGVEFADASASTTTFVMPTNDVTVTAVFRAILVDGIDPQGYPWTGKAIEPKVTVALDGVDLCTADQYEVTYANNVNSGKATVTVTMLPPLDGSKTVEFTILPQPSVSNVTVTAHEPWDGKVDLAFDVGGNWSGLADWNRPYLSIVATDNVTGSNYVSAASALTGDTDAADGAHAVEWDFDAQGLAFASPDVTFTVAYVNMPDWCVIDLSGGTNAVSYPVTYVSDVADVPATFNTDAYKTTNLVMRLIGPEADGKQPFYCAMFETTQKQWELVTGGRPSYFTNETYYATRPVEQVSYNMIRGDAATYDWPETNAVDEASFLGVLRQKTGLAALDLPTEAQWEYACRAGTTSKYNNGGDSEADLRDLGRYWNNGGSDYSDSCATDHGTAAVGAYKPNDWGLYDMHGNVFEWCLNPSGSDRVVRSGSWDTSADYCTSSVRYYYYSSNGSNGGGFRLVRTLSNNFESERSAVVCAGAASEPIRVGKDFTADEIQLADYAGTYDGEGHTIGIATNAIPGLVLRYDGQDEPPLFTNVCDSVVSVEASAPGYFTFTTNATVTIVPRSVTLTSASAEKVYDGTPLTCAEVLVGGDGFAPGEGAYYGVSGSHKNAGVEENAFTYTLKAGTDAANYAITTVNGWLTVTRRVVTLTSASAEKAYDGTPLTCAEVLVGGDGFAPGEGATFEVTGSQTGVGVGTNTFTYTLKAGMSEANSRIVTSNGTLTVTKAANAWTAAPSIAGWTYGEAAGVPDFGGATFGAATVTYSAEPGDAGDYTATFTVEGTENYDGLSLEVPFTIARASIEASAESYEGVYDGEGHGIEVTVTKPAAGATVKYALAEDGPYSEDAILFTNATDGVVWYVVEADSYSTVTNSATVKIAKRSVTLTSASAEKVYDGAALTTNEVAVGGDGFAPGEGATYEVTGAQTHVGTSENTFTYALDDGTDAGNYEIATAYGTLTVTKAGNAWTADPSIAGWTFGEAAGEPDFGGAAFGAATVTYSAEPGGAGDYTATFTIEGTEDYDGLAFEVPFTIDAKELTAQMVALDIPEGGYVYDGAAKEPAVSVVCGGRQLVEGDDYEVAYLNNVEAGAATATVTGIGNYSGTVARQFEIAEHRGHVLWPADTELQLDRAATFNGYLADADGAVAGTIRVRAGRPNRRTGASRVTVTVQILGQRRISLRGTTADGSFAAESGGMALDLQLRQHSFIGTFGPYSLDGAMEMSSAGDAETKAAAEQAMKRIAGNYAVAWRNGAAGGWNAFSVSVRKKGRVKASGTLSDGTRVMSNALLLVGSPVTYGVVGAQLMLGESECAVPMSWKANGAQEYCLMWISEDGSVECTGLPEGATAIAAAVGDGAPKAGAEFRIDAAALAEAMPGLMAELLPDGVDVMSAKKGQSKLKIRYNAKTGRFKGSFKIFVASGERVRTVTARVAGVVVDGKGYGSARVKKGVSCAVTIE